MTSAASPSPDTAFDSLPLSPDTLANLRTLGFDAMTPVQAAALPVALAGRDLIAQAKTGSGKTAAFALPLLARLNPRWFSPQALVLCPTRELADQVAKEIRRLARGTDNIKVLTLCGGSNIHTEDGSGANKHSMAQLVAQSPELVLIARSGTGVIPVVDRVGVDRWQTAGLPAARLGRVFMIDADAVFRSGPRLIEAAEPICELIEQSRK